MRGIVRGRAKIITAVAAGAAITGLVASLDAVANPPGRTSAHAADPGTPPVAPLDEGQARPATPSAPSSGTGRATDGSSADSDMTTAPTRRRTAPAGTPRRDNSRTERVYLVHGLNTRSRTDCSATWRAALWSLRRDGWKGPLDTVGYYRDDAHCAVAVTGRAGYTSNTSIKELGRAFAWLVYRRDTRHGRSVDVVAHSMGGLVVRAALAGVRDHEKGFPPRLYIEDVVSVGTPHDGGLLSSCTVLECRQMREQDGGGPVGALLDRLDENPQSTQGTDWTLIASDADTLVPAASALGMDAGHKVRYAADEALGHGGTIFRPRPSRPERSGYHLRYSWSAAPGVHETENGWAPLHMVFKALYYWRTW